MDLREQIGQRLVTGFPGTELTEDFRRMVREYKISNVILFRENITDCAQLKQLCGEIQALVRRETGHGAFITADQEGGLVTRLPGDAVNVPGAMAIAATGDPENAYRAGLLTGRELRALGVNFDLAPSVDVNSNPENPVIGARSYGDTPQEVSRYANRMIRGLLDGGVLCSAKHFPGHGDTDTDSHLALPCVDKSMEELERTELLPFREAVRAGVPAVMTTHILFPQLEPEHLPATMSRRIMTGLLREQMGFDGLIVSDCMEMRAIKDHFGTVNGVVAAMAAGVDLVFISHDTLLSGQAARAAEQAVAEGRLSAAEMQASVQRILALKEKWVDGMPEGGFDFDAARRENEALLQKTITEVHRPAGGRPALGSAPLCIGCPAYRTSLVGNVDAGETNRFGDGMARALHGSAAAMQPEPGREEIAALVELARRHTSAVVGTFNGRLRRGQLELVARLAEAGLFAGVLLMPVLPFLEDNVENVRAVAEAAAEAGARFVYPAFGMTLRDQQREYYYQALEKGFPGLAERYRRQYGPRYECPSPRAKALWAALEERCRALGLLCRMRDITAAYQRGYGERQLTFF